MHLIYDLTHICFCNLFVTFSSAIMLSPGTFLRFSCFFSIPSKLQYHDEKEDEYVGIQCKLILTKHSLKSKLEILQLNKSTCVFYFQIGQQFQVALQRERTNNSENPPFIFSLSVYNHWLRHFVSNSVVY